MKRIFQWVSTKFSGLYADPADIEKRKKEAYLASLEGQEEQRKQKIAMHMAQIAEGTKKGQLSQVETCLENLLDICTDEEMPPPGAIKSALYTAGKNQAIAVYNKKGFDPANLASVVQDVAKAQEKLLGKPLDANVWIAYVHRELFEDTKLYLKSLRGKPNSIDAAAAIAQTAMKLLTFGAYSPAEVVEQENNIRKLLAQNIMALLKFLAINGFATDFELFGKRFMNLLENADLTPEQMRNNESWLNQTRVSCYNNRFMNYTAAFNAGNMTLKDLIDCARDNNQVAKDSGMPEDGSVKIYAGVTPAAYKLEMERLLCSIDPKMNGKHPISRQHAKAVLNRVKKYMLEAKLDPEQTVDLTASISRIRDAYREPSNNGHHSWRDDGKQQMYKNPQYDRRSRQFTKKHR